MILLCLLESFDAMWITLTALKQYKYFETQIIYIYTYIDEWIQMLDINLDNILFWFLYDN